MGLFDGTPLERPVTCEVCGKELAACRCPRNAAGKVTLPKDQAARVRRERRNGKWVTVVTGLDPAATDLPALLKRLKTECAAGGAVTEDGVEVQGDQRERVAAMLRGMGYGVKLAGG